MAIDPMHQFLIEKVVAIPPFQIGGMVVDLSITNSVVMMLAGALTLCLLLGAASRGALVPGRMQAVGEAFYDLVEGVLVTPIIGPNGRPYIPFIMTLFMFIFVMNMLGVILSLGSIGGLELTFTPTAQLAVTVGLAALTIGTVIVVGFLKHGLGLFKMFLPPGLPLPMLIVMAPIEFISFAVRPLTLSMRLFGNMVGGHVVLYIFASFVISLGLLGMSGGIIHSLGFLGSAASLAMIVLLSALELLVAFLQAFVFAALATVYLNEVVNLGHAH